VKNFSPISALVFYEKIVVDLGGNSTICQLQVRDKSFSSILMLVLPIFKCFFGFSEENLEKKITLGRRDF